jgi:Cu(I)/Ag(I) efflux system membrane fusion protein
MKPIYIALAALALLVGVIVGTRVLHHPAQNNARRILYYQDPMHPQYRSPKPGIAPDCGMDLVPVYADEANAGKAADAGVVIDGERQRQFGIQTIPAALDSGASRLRLFARIQADETRVFKLEFGTDGYVRETHDDATGTHVAKGQKLATVYSPEFLTVAGGYLAANERMPVMGNAPKDPVPPGSQGPAAASARADRLRNLGMSDVQIDEITRTHKIPEDVYVVSPVDGFILARNITAGSRFERHNELYTIADLSVVWVEAEAYGNNADAVRVGQHASVVVPGTARSVDAVVVSVLPELDSNTHATKIRLKAENRDYKLRPGMFVNAELPATLSKAVTIPVDAVIDSGAAQRVFVRTNETNFTPRLIRTGTQVGDRIQVVSGLEAGEVVVRSGAFLVDSEARLRNP